MLEDWFFIVLAALSLPRRDARVSGALAGVAGCLFLIADSGKFNPRVWHAELFAHLTLMLLCIALFWELAMKRRRTA